MYFPLIIGLIMIFFAIRANKKRKWLAKNGTRVQGIISGLDEQEMNEKVIYFPIVKIDDPVLGAREIRLSSGTSIMRKVGSRIELVYPPGEPDDIREHSDAMTMGHLILLIVGIFFTLFGLGWITVSLLWDYFINS